MPRPHSVLPLIYSIRVIVVYGSGTGHPGKLAECLYHHLITLSPAKAPNDQLYILLSLITVYPGIQ